MDKEIDVDEATANVRAALRDVYKSAFKGNDDYQYTRDVDALTHAVYVLRIVRRT